MDKSVDIPGGKEYTAKPITLDKVIGGIKFGEMMIFAAGHHAGDGGYSIGTQEKYEEFVKKRNEKTK